MIDVSMMTMNCASAMRARADQRRRGADCMGAAFLSRRCGSIEEMGEGPPDAEGERQAAVAHRPSAWASRPAAHAPGNMLGRSWLTA